MENSAGTTYTTYRDFEIQYKGNRILVRNEGEYGERLFINGVLQDQNMGPGNGFLTGNLYNRNNTITDTIEVRLEMKTLLECAIYANGEIIYSNVYSEELAEKKRARQSAVHEMHRRVNRRMFLFLGVISICIILLKILGTAGAL